MKKTTISPFNLQIKPLTMQRIDRCNSGFSQDDVKRMVRNTINDEMFWKDILNQLRVHTMVDERLDREVPKKVKDHLDYTLAGLVAQKIQEQLPNVVNNNYQMRQLFNGHAKDLEEKLSVRAKQILEEIVGDPKYHEVNRAYFEAFINKGDLEIGAFRNRASAEIESMHQRYNDEFAELRTSIALVNTYQERTQELEKQVWWLKVGFGGLASAVIGAFVYVFSNSSE